MDAEENGLEVVRSIVENVGLSNQSILMVTF
jgi:hypothetical protein